MDATPGSATPSDATIERLLAHSEWLNALARRLVGDPSAADDLVQDAWCAALERGDRDDGALTSERGWLAAVLANLARRKMRSEHARGRRERASASREAVEGPAALVERAEAQRKLLAALLALDEPYRSTLLARYVEGSTPARIAATTGVNESTVRTRLARGHAELRKSLGEQNGRAWMAALAPLCALDASRHAAAAKTALVTSVANGVWIMSTTSKVAVACALVVAAAWFLLPQTSTDPVGSAEEAASARTSALDASRESPSAPSTPARAPELPDAPPAATASAAQPPDAQAESSWIEIEIRRGSVPVEGASVWIAPSTTWLPIECLDMNAPVPPDAKRARTDASGVARFASKPGRAYSVCFDLRADAERPMRYAGERIHAGFRHVVQLGDASVRGTVYDARGRPREGVGVMAASTEADVHHKLLAAMTRTDASGRYEIGDIAPATIGWDPAPTLVVVETDGRFDGRPEPERKSVVLHAGEALTVDFGTPSGLPTFSGRVLTRTGEPFAGGGSIRLRSPDERDELHGVVDADGRFALAFAPGAWNVHARMAGAPGAGFDLGRIELPAHDVESDLVVEGARVHGQLYSASGRLLTEHRPWVSLRPKGHEYPAAIRTVVPERGRFVFEGVEPGEWVIGIHPLELVPGEVVELTIAPSEAEHAHDLHVTLD